MRYRMPKVKGSPYSITERIGFRSWSRFLAVSLQVTWVINPAVGCHYFPPGVQLPSQPLRWLLPISLLGEQRHDGCEQFAYSTASRLRFEPRFFCVWVQHANHSATEPSIVCLQRLILRIKARLPQQYIEGSWCPLWEHLAATVHDASQFTGRCGSIATPAVGRRTRAD